MTDKNQEVDNFEGMICEACRERVYERNFDARNRNEDTAAICEECMDVAMHLRCMRNTQKEMWEEDRIWLCTTCLDEMSSSSSYGSCDCPECQHENLCESCAAEIDSLIN